MDHVLPWGDSPIDLPGDSPIDLPDGPAVMDGAAVGTSVVPLRRISGVGWATGAVLTSSLALLAFNSHALANWADQLPVVPATARLVAVADDWHARAQRLGLNDVVERVERAAAVMRDAQWPQRPVQLRSEDRAKHPVTGVQR
jgi:hypothetical protein